MRHIKLQKSKKPNKNRGSAKRNVDVNRKVMKSYLHLSITYLHKVRVEEKEKIMVKCKMYI